MTRVGNDDASVPDNAAGTTSLADISSNTVESDLINATSIEICDSACGSEGCQATTQSSESTAIIGDKIDDDPTQQAQPTHPAEYLSGDWEIEPFYYSAQCSGVSGGNGNYLNTNSNRSSPYIFGSGNASNDNNNNDFSIGSNRASGSDRRNKRGLVYKSREDCDYKCFQDQEG